MIAEVLPGWKLKSEGVVLPEERLPAGQTIIVGLQHVFTMVGSTVVLPIFVGFGPNVAILFPGVGTLIFLSVPGFPVISARAVRSVPSNRRHRLCWIRRKSKY